MHACVCGLYLISAFCHHLICGLPPFGCIVLSLPYIKVSESGLEAVARWGEVGVVYLEEKKARKVKIKLL